MMAAQPKVVYVAAQQSVTIVQSKALHIQAQQSLSIVPKQQSTDTPMQPAEAVPFDPNTIVTGAPAAGSDLSTPPSYDDAFAPSPAYEEADETPGQSEGVGVPNC